MIGRFAVSKSGHDKGTVYIIVNEEEEYVYLCDGNYKKLENPKRKNKKHITILKKHMNIENTKMIHDEQIKQNLKIYNLNLSK